MDAYRTLAEPASARLTRERSRFLALAEPATLDVVEERLAALRRVHHDATHVCSAYRCRDRDTLVGRGDDAGEPRGSAGTPILQTLESADLVDVLLVVARHFGGVKLGVGGLVRAYSNAAAAALAAGRIVERRVEVVLRVVFPHEANATVLRLIARHEARLVHIRYDSHAEAFVALPPSRASTFGDAVREASGARATIERMP